MVLDPLKLELQTTVNHPVGTAVRAASAPSHRAVPQPSMFVCLLFLSRYISSYPEALGKLPASVVIAMALGPCPSFCTRIEVVLLSEARNFPGSPAWPGPRATYPQEEALAICQGPALGLRNPDLKREKDERALSTDSANGH